MIKASTSKAQEEAGHYNLMEIVHRLLHYALKSELLTPCFQ